MKHKSLIVAAILACGAAALFVWHQREKNLAAATTASQKQAAAPVPVLVATAEAKDVPIILRGLGNVVAYDAVELTSRVEGTITEIKFREGQEVRVGDVLFQLDARPFQAALDQARAALARDQASLANAETDLQRYAKLLKQNSIAEQQYATQRSLVAQIQATVQNDQAAIEAAELNVEYATITSPIDGVTGIRQVDLGNLVAANTQPLVVLTQIKPIYVVFTLPETDIRRVREAMANHKLTVFAFDSKDERKIAEGVLDLVDNAVDQTTGTVKLKAEFPNKDAALWPGEFVNAHLVLDVARNGVTVPSAAIQTGPNGLFVYAVKENSTVEMRPVTVVQTENNVALVGFGLAAGERVVTAGQFRLQQDSKVTVSSGLATPGPSSPGNAPLGTGYSQ